MKKYRVAMARTETTMYYYDVEAEDEGIAEEIATDRYTNDERYTHRSIVWGEDEVHSVKELKNED
jgi:hypothetical protein